MQAGAFVHVEGLALGLGKLQRRDESVAEVAYFASPASGEAYRVTVDPSRLRPVTLLAQTRVYWYDQEGRSWLVGRIAEDGRIEGRYLGGDEDYYLIDLPNRQFARVPISTLQVRWDRPVDDPVAYLAARTTETPFWHLGRREFLRQAVDQRAVCSSLTGLWSAAVDLVFHQVRAVRKVLTDPVQRYLLADEVGLGKTIEAGAVLRQYVLDEPETHRAMVIVPEHLVAQWTDELTVRFYLGRHLGQTVHVVSETDREAVRRAGDELGMLIVDEAHRPAAMAFSHDADERRFYAELARVASRTSRVLLLSATPVLRNEDGFLAMLHLLDSEAYALDDREAFRLRVQNRQQLAETLSDLQPDSPSLFVEDALQTLERLTAGDCRARSLIARVRQGVDLDGDASERLVALRDLREHVSEVYRLHRRLVRNRRETVSDVLRDRVGATIVRVDDPVRSRFAELLELWREHANLHLQSVKYGVVSSGEGSVRARQAGDAAGIYWLLVQAAASHPAALREAVAARRFDREPVDDLMPLSQEDLGLLHAPEAFPDEERILDALLAVDGAEGSPRLEAVVEVARGGDARGLKTILFVDAPGVADRLAEELGASLSGAVLRHAPGRCLDPFLDPDGEARVLVCDRRAEEGLNLRVFRSLCG